MRKHHPENERTKRRYFEFMKHATANGFAHRRKPSRRGAKISGMSTLPPRSPATARSPTIVRRKSSISFVRERKRAHRRPEMR